MEIRRGQHAARRFRSHRIDARKLRHRLLGDRPAGMLSELSADLHVSIRDAGLLITWGAAVLCFARRSWRG